MSNGIHDFQVAHLIKRLSPLPQPGEIWKLRRLLQSSMDLPAVLFSRTAQAYLEGEREGPFGVAPCANRYVMIVKEPSLGNDSYQEVSVMVLSSDIQHLSQIDLRLPTHLSGLDFDLLAETWHVLKMLTCNLLEPVGKRLSRSVYDILLTVGDQDPITSPHRREIEAVGLEVGTCQPSQSSFHQQEREWSDVLRVPVAAHQAYLEAMDVAQRSMTQVIQLERDLMTTQAPQINLSQWFRNQFEAGWLAIAEVLNPIIERSEVFGKVAMLGAARSLKTEKQGEPDPEILTQLIQQLASEQSPHQHRKAARRLGEIAKGYQPAIEALIQLMNTTQEEEVFWTAVESLSAIAPEHPATGIRRIKRIDLGMQLDRQAVALSVAIIQKLNQSVTILLQVYPLDNAPYLPEHLQLTLLDDAERSLRTVTARKADLYIQLKLTGQVGEQFSVRVSLGNSSITEDFL